MGKTLYFGGTILTMDRALPRAEALLTEDGRIIGAGALRQLECLAEGAEYVDLRGMTLMPAFVDSHSHMAQTGLFLQECDLIGCRSFQDILSRIRAFREKKDLTHGEIIRCVGYDPTLLREGRHPAARLLDSLGFDNPIACLHQSKHMGAYNTRAMELCGVSASAACPEGGVVGRDEKGRLTGYFEGRAMAPFFKVMDRVTPDDFERAVLAAQEYYFRFGITTIQDGSPCTAEQVACYERLADTGRLKADVVIYLAPDGSSHSFWKDILARRGNRAYRGHLKIGGTKLVLDGSPQAKTAWMRAPYAGEPGYRGYPRFSDAEVRAVLEHALKTGLQPLAHCNGDAASEQFLSVWEKAVAEAGHGQELRPVMIHSQTVGYDQLDRMGRVGMTPSFFIGHCFFWGDTHLRNFGPERGSRISPVRAALERGLSVSLHQDSPVTAPDMLHSVWCAVNRITRSGVCIGPENRIDVRDALIAVTQGGAYSYFEEDAKGVLRPSAAADLVILDRDPTAVDPMTIRDIQVLCTIKDGCPVYEKVPGAFGVRQEISGPRSP